MTASALKVAEVAANNAAADAARDARAEAEAAAKKRAPEKPQKPADGWHRFLVDIWITDFNFTEFGIYKHTRNRAKSRQFTADMDIFGEIIENGERTGLLGYREELWKKAKGMDKRLVFKLFSDNLTWRATMDLLTARSLQQTIGARGLPVTTFAINTDEDSYVIYLERSANKWPLMPEHFSFFIMDGKQNPEFYRLKRDFINFGGDYTLYDQTGNVVGYLDGAVFSIGGKWRGRVKEGHADKRLLMVMKLFAGMMIFNGDTRRHMKTLYRGVMSGKLKPDIERTEADLYLNPRRVR